VNLVGNHFVENIEAMLSRSAINLGCVPLSAAAGGELFASLT
jgi:hypothetical protein